MSDDNLFEFPADPQDVEITLQGGGIHRRERRCQHRVVVIYSGDGDRSDRGARCEDCEEWVDPMSVLIRYARNDDKLRRQAHAWKNLQGAWAWLYEHGGTLSLSKKGGVRASAIVNGGKISRRGTALWGETLAGQIVAAICALVPWNELADQEWTRYAEDKSASSKS